MNNQEIEVLWAALRTAFTCGHYKDLSERERIVNAVGNWAIGAAGAGVQEGPQGFTRQMPYIREIHGAQG